MVANLTIGHATIDIDNIVPGNNTFTVRASLDTEVVGENIEEIIKDQIPHLREGNILVTATGVSVVHDGENLEYWGKALQALKIKVKRPLKEIVRMMLDNRARPSMAWWEPARLMDTIIEGLVDEVLEGVKELDDEKLEEYAERLGTLGRVVSRLLRSLGIF